MGNWNVTDFYNDPNKWYGHGRALRGNAESALSRSAFRRLLGLRELPGEKLSAENFVGGYELRDGKICLFRACGGGRERNGRPGRWVFLAFEADAKKFGGSDLIGTLTSGAFADYARTPVPPEAPCPPDSEEPEAVPAGEKSEYRIPSALDERVERKFLAISRIGGETKVLAEKETRKPQPRAENVPKPRPQSKETVRRGKKPSLAGVVLAAILVLAVILVSKTCSRENPRSPASESSMVQEK